MNTEAVNLTGIFHSQAVNWIMVLWLPIFTISIGYFVYFNPSFLELVITLNLWLLGYHHLVSTYSRIAFDWQSVKENWKFVFLLPILVLSCVYGIFKLGGVIWIGSIYLYWQWYHYTRQSEGVSKAFGMKSDDKSIINDKLHRFLFYIIPILCLLMMVSRNNQMFFGSSFFSIPLSNELRYFIGVTIALLTIFASFRIILFAKSQRVTLFYAVYLLSHFAIYIVAYVAIDKITTGWLVINIWHNTQYIAIVWLFNTNRFKSGINPKHRLISYLSQPEPGRILIYLLSFILLTLLFYGFVNIGAEYIIGTTGLPAILIIYSTLNFHHYIVDSQIWKLRKKTISKNLS